MALRASALVCAALLLDASAASAAATEIVPDFSARVIGSPRLDSFGDVSNEADIRFDDAGVLLYSAKVAGSAIVVDGGGNRYLGYRVSVDENFSQKLFINLNIDGSAGAAGLDDTVDVAIIVDAGEAPAVYVSGTTADLDNAHPNSTAFFITDTTRGEYQVVDAVVAKPATGCATNCHLDVVFNFDEMQALMLDDSTADGDAQVVRSAFSTFTGTTPLQLVLASSAGFSTVDGDIAGSVTNDGALLWTSVFNPEATLEEPDYDADGDGVPTFIEDTNLDGGPDPGETNPNLVDTDADGLCDGNIAVPGSCVAGEPARGTDPADDDSDNDGIPDGVEAGFTATGTRILGANPTNPTAADTDHDLKCDGGIAVQGSCVVGEDRNANGLLEEGETDPTNPCDPTSGNACIADADFDNMSDVQEALLGTDTADADSDDDGFQDGLENLRGVDSDGDGLINALDPDSDNDGLFDGTEGGVDCDSAATDLSRGTCIEDADPATTTSSIDPDADHGGLFDGGEDANLDGAIDSGEGNPNVGGGSDDSTQPDADGDRLSDAAEAFRGTDPADADTDDDGVPDGIEANPTADTDNDGITNVLDPDSDNDGLFDGTELGFGCLSPGVDPAAAACVADADPTTTTSPLLADTDGGGFQDGAEDFDRNGRVDFTEFDANFANDDADIDDNDGDGMPDAAEVAVGFDPLDGDADDDGVIDGAEPDGSADTDGDGLINARDSDSDGDGMFDGTELGIDCSGADTDSTAIACIPDADPATRTLALKLDTDGGGAADGVEDENHNGKVDDGERDPLDPTDDIPPPPDEDADGVLDEIDNCIRVANADQGDRDSDGKGDACDPDADSDGFDDSLLLGGGGLFGGCSQSANGSSLVAMGALVLALRVRRRREMQRR